MNLTDAVNRQEQRRVTDLITEFTAVMKMRDVEAYRAAFMVLAHRNQWQNAQIARSLGISRARVGQRLAKLQAHVDGETRYAGQVPVLTKFMNEAKDANVRSITDPRNIEFMANMWDDKEFAMTMIGKVA